MANRADRRRLFDPARRAAPGQSEYDRLPAGLKRDYVVGLEHASEKIARELNATRLALAVMLDRHGGEAMIGEADLKRIDGKTITSAEVDLTGGWLFRLVDRPD